MSWFQSRSNILLLVMVVLLAALGIRLYYIIGIEGEALANEASSNTVKSIATDSPRGAIYDRNGVILAGNKSIFTVSIARNGMSAEKLNESILQLIEILDKNEETMIDNFPIVFEEDGSLSFTFEKDVAKWLIDNQLPLGMSAEDAYNEIRERNSIDPSLDNYDAQLKLIEVGENPPISLDQMQYSRLLEKREFLQRFKLDPDKKQNAEEVFKVILNYYGIDQYKDISIETSRKMAIIRNELSRQGFTQYIPIKVALYLSQETIIEIEEKEHDLEGVSVNTETARYYPYGSTASQIIGYLGKISDANMDEYVNKRGYKADDMIGMSGIELALEETLHGTDGLERVQVDSVGNMVRKIGDSTSPKKGTDVVLTIDVRLQKIAEDALAKNLKAIRAGGSFGSEFGDMDIEEKSANAQVGAAVVLDVKTGEPLAIADTNSFDPNAFAEGITDEAWASLQVDNPRDPMAPRPLYSTALRTAVQPGSIFKPLTGIVALESGLDPKRNVYDKKVLEYGDHEYSCLGSHGYVNLYTGIQYSCNYYFFDIASGRDWASGGADLGYKDNISIKKISEYAAQFGLGVKSGIELQETIMPAPSAERKMASTKSMLFNYLISQCEYFFDDTVLKDYDELITSINEIVSWTEENPSIGEVENRLLNLGVRESEYVELAKTCKYTYYGFATWSMGDVFNIAIGQGENSFTPLQMARYVATIGNGGTLNNASLLKAVEGKGEVTRDAGVPAQITDPKNIDDVLKGMSLVVAGGSMTPLKSLGIKLAGKTGTAQRAGYVNPPNEVEYVKKYLKKINPKITWREVETEMYRLMAEYPKIYDTSDKAVRRAVASLSGRNFNQERIDAYKDTYNDFSWNVVLAPADDPEIAVVVMLVQGGTSSNALPATREIVGQYFKLKKQDEKNKFSVDYNTFFDKDNRENTVEKVFAKKK